jgi:Family of unknown function (DUF5335)
MSQTTAVLLTQQIKPDQWTQFLAEFTRDYRGAHGRLEVLGVDEVRYAVETENKPFDGVSADTKDGERSVWIIFGATASDHLSHGIHGAIIIRMLPPSGGKGPVLEVEAKDGTKTVLGLSLPQEYALPEGTPQDRRRS